MANGRFSDKDLIRIWSEPQFAEKQSELLNLMKNREFKICYEHKDGYYLAPQLFDDKEVNYEWRTYENNLVFRYNYTFMPKGILSQLIVMLNQYIYKNTFWKYGVLLANKNSRAIITENRFKNENIITIRVEGIHKGSLLTIIGNNIEEINSSYTNLEVSEEFACICDECNTSDDPHYFDTKTINNFINNRKKHLVCLKSTDQIEINKLLGNYIPIGQIQAYGQRGTSNITNIYGSNNFVEQGNNRRDLSCDPYEKTNGISENVEEGKRKKEKVKFVTITITAILFVVATVLISVFYPDKWKILTPPAVVILAVVAFWDKILGIIKKTQDISKEE